MSICSSCGQPILWATTTNGSKIPLNPEPVAGANIVLENGVAHIIPLNAGPLFGDGGMRYVAHFATCPSAAKHRKKKN